jgi:hypothetical protein
MTSRYENAGWHVPTSGLGVTLRPILSNLRIALLAGVLSLAVGGAAASGQGRLALAGLGAAAGIVVLWRWNAGVLLGVLLFAQLGGFGNHPSKATETLLFSFQAVVLLCSLITRPRQRLTRPERYVMTLAALGFAWWTLTALRTIVVEGGTFAGVLGGGRDLAYIFLIAPLSMLVFRDRQIRRGLIAAISAGAAIYLVSWLLYSRGIHGPEALLNIQHVTSVYGLSRLYTPLHYVGNLAACFGIALAFRGPTRRARWLGVSFASAAVLVIALQLTRATYFGLGLGTVVVLAVWAAQSRIVGQGSLRVRVFIAVAALVVTIIGFIVIPVAEDSTLGSVSQRVSSGVENLQSGTGSVGRREEKASAILVALDGKWLTGLGFWTPSTHYFVGVPNGEIRDGDLGVLNIYATEGVVGVILLYVPLLILLIVLMAYPSRGGFDAQSARRSFPDHEDHRDVWLLLGAAIWLLMVLASSITLGDLSSRPGASVSSYVIGLALAILVTTKPAGASSSWGHGNRAP